MDDIRGPPTSEFRPRRPHTKSRNGCAQCKRRRIKCDERIPRCTRCERGNFPCDYPKPRPPPTSPEEHLSAETSEGSDIPSPGLTGLIAPGPSLTRAVSSSSLHPASSDLSTRSVSPCLSAPGDFQASSFVRTQAADMLDVRDLELFSHYLVHTSRNITFDQEDLFALQVGIPNLAFSCKPLMSSVLASAATCQCCDIISQSARLPSDRRRVIELLGLANRHHMESLQDIQATISHTGKHDEVLANAILMVMYGSASQNIRIWLARTRDTDETLADEFLPGQSEWISLFRAAHLAYIGMLERQSYDIHGLQEVSGRKRVSSNPTPSVLQPPSRQDGSISPTEQPSNSSRHVLFPILVATSSSALEKLRESSQSLLIDHAGTMDDMEMTSSAELLQRGGSLISELQACCIALDILSDIAAETCSMQEPLTETTSPAFDTSFHPACHLAEVSDWLQGYLMRATGLKHSRPLRRVVTAFLNRVPEEYITLVQRSLDLMSAEPMVEHQAAWVSGNRGFSEIGVSEQLAMDIFAHWLVFVMLLDGVWWIGDIGFWELGRVIALLQQHPSSVLQHTDVGEDWWPLSMYRVGMELRKHTIRRS